jgi:hypothetical protein
MTAQRKKDQHTHDENCMYRCRILRALIEVESDAQRASVKKSQLNQATRTNASIAKIVFELMLSESLILTTPDINVYHRPGKNATLVLPTEQGREFYEAHQDFLADARIGRPVKGPFSK